MAFQTALSGLNAASGNLNVTGNNIANSSTTGFKKSRAEFADVYATSFGGVSSTATGAGVRMSNVSQQFTQGNIDFTENNLDLAISGEGFFIVDDNGSELYTRSGAFHLDREGYIVNAHDQRLQVYDSLDSNGLATSLTPADLQLTAGTSAASETEEININFNLDADATQPTGGAIVLGSPVAAVNEPSPDQYNFSTSLTVYDSLGGSHTANFYFVKTANPREWDVYMGVRDANDALWVDGPQTIDFDDDGSLSAASEAASPVAFFGGSGGAGFDPGNASAPLGFDLDYNDPGLLGSTQYAGQSAVNALLQDGYSTGRLAGINIDNRGVISARYTNGVSTELGAVAMATFPNTQGLQSMGDTNWAATFEAGAALYGQAGVGTFGEIQSGALEASNVDISKELVNMIIAQRDYQANAKMISTEDQVTQTIINIR